MESSGADIVSLNKCLTCCAYIEVDDEQYHEDWHARMIAHMGDLTYHANKLQRQIERLEDTIKYKRLR